MSFPEASLSFLPLAFLQGWGFGAPEDPKGAVNLWLLQGGMWGACC